LYPPRSAKSVGNVAVENNFVENGDGVIFGSGVGEGDFGSLKL
jgi:hypothetical protein